MMNFDTLSSYFRNKIQDHNWYLELRSRPMDYTEKQINEMVEQAAKEEQVNLPNLRCYEENQMYLRLLLIKRITEDTWPL